MVYKVLVDPRHAPRDEACCTSIARRGSRARSSAASSRSARRRRSRSRILFNSATRAGSERPRQFERAARQGTDDALLGSGCGGDLPEFSGRPSLAGPSRPCWPLMMRFRNMPGGPASKDFLRGYAYGVYIEQWRRSRSARLRRGLQERRHGPSARPGHAAGVWRMPALRRQLRGLSIRNR